MNLYKALNQITLYIENHLEEKIEYEVLAHYMGVNVYTMQRLFSLLTGITLADYIRKRRLSSAGFDLAKTNCKVMDIAMRYQYDSATSFSRAFTSFHGIKPSKVSLVTKLKNFPRMQFKEETMQLTDMEYEIVQKDKMVLYGLGIPTNCKKIKMDAPIFCTKMYYKYQKKYGKFNYGMITYDSKDRHECNQYYLLYEKKIPEFEKIEIPASKWLVLRTDSHEAEAIQKTSDQFYHTFLSTCKYHVRDLPELEYYHDRGTDLFIPIENQ